LKHLRRTMRELLPLLPSSARRFLLLFGVLSAVLALLDSAALGVFALVLNQILKGGSMTLPVFGSVSQEFGLLLLVSSAMVMILKSVLNIWLQWVSTRKFADYELEIGTVLFQSYIRAPWTERMKRSTTELVRMIDVGIANTVAGVLFPAVTLPAQALTFASVLVVLIGASWQTALATVIYLGAIAAFLYLWLSKKSYEAGKVNRDAAMRMSKLVSEMLGALKEITLRDKADEVGAVVMQSRERAARSRSNIRFMGSVPKFVIDMALIGGFLLIGTVGYLIGGIQAAMSSVAIFGLAGFKMVPALTQMQSQLTLVQSTLPYTETVMGDIRDAAEYRKNAEKLGKTPIEHEPKTLELKNVEFTYPGAGEPAVQNINLRLPIGSSVGVVGQSGAGKSTLIDIFLGLLTPSKGTMTLDGVPLEEVLSDWRKRVGYVPQEVAIFDGSVAQNVALTWGKDIDEERVLKALERAQLLETIESRKDGIHGRVGERGLALSGGQRQRLGIARALYMNPLVLVLDEATSALDTGTEAAVAKAISELHGEMTVISVAHRLSTIRNNDLVCFMKEGSIVSQGTFDEVVEQNPDFAEHAALAGLHNRDGDDSAEEDAGDVNDARQNAAQEFAAKQPLGTRGAGS
jgi:ABC-type multidrug transport system fused ATPase/permease subunit